MDMVPFSSKEFIISSSLYIKPYYAVFKLFYAHVGAERWTIIQTNTQPYKHTWVFLDNNTYFYLNELHVILCNKVPSEDHDVELFKDEGDEKEVTFDELQLAKEGDSILEPIVKELQTTRSDVLMKLQKLFLIMQVSAIG